MVHTFFGRLKVEAGGDSFGTPCIMVMYSEVEDTLQRDLYTTDWYCRKLLVKKLSSNFVTEDCQATYAIITTAVTNKVEPPFFLTCALKSSRY